MPDVFVSYKRENEAKVARLIAALEAQGLESWWDREIPAGAPWETTIEHQLSSAKAVVVCWSKAAIASENVRSEARLARNQNRLVQVFLEPCEPPLFFGERQGIDLGNWRGKADDPRILKLAQAARAISEGKTPSGLIAPTPSRAWMSQRALLVAAVATLLAVAGAWLILMPGANEGPTTLAVLPFRALSAADANLTDAIADDTRSAIGRNPNLRVLGRLAVTALADQGLAPADFRKKVHADYLLDGSVERSGARLRIKVSLTRTKDSAEVWADKLDGSIDDVFAFQGRIASEVEGRIRGRLAPNKGIKAENIATSGEVYSIYADARALNRKRAPGYTSQGVALLRSALAIDPNFAPAWAELGIIIGIRGASPGHPKDKVRQEAVGYLQRALTLAPNLAVAHGGLAMVQDFPPQLEPELLKAVALDPNSADAWNWLGNMRGSQNRMRDALEAHKRAHEIEPLWSTPIGNMIGEIIDVGDDRELLHLLAEIDRTGDAALKLKARFFEAAAKGHPGEAIRIGVKLRAEQPTERSFIDVRMARTLIQLGFIDEGVKLARGDPAAIPVYRGVPPLPKFLHYDRPVEFWLDDDGPMLAARLLPKAGRSNEFVGYYNAAFASPDDFFNFSPSSSKGLFRSFAPNVAVLLRAAGQAKDADAILARDEQLILGLLRNGPGDGGMLINLAQLRAAQGRDNQAVKLIAQAIAKGYLPDRQFESVDIADEPCFAELLNRDDFQRLRQRILYRIKQERQIAAPSVAMAKF